MTTNLNFESEFLLRNPRGKHILSHFRKAIGTDSIDWQDITKLNMERFSTYLTACLAQNSARTYFAVMKAFVARFSEEGIIPCTNPKGRIKATPSQHIALTFEEVRRLDRYVPCSPLEQDVLTIFMRGCLTGARYSDAVGLSMSNVKGDTVVYVSRKTQTETVLPLHSMLRKYLRPLSSVPNPTTMNVKIKQICRKVGIDGEVQLFVGGTLRRGPKYGFVTEHTSRRTFCTILAMMNVPTELISKYAGHSNSQITSSRYICIDTATPTEEVMRFFKAR